jgi:hypothetical protein
MLHHCREAEEASLVEVDPFPEELVAFLAVQAAYPVELVAYPEELAAYLAVQAAYPVELVAYPVVLVAFLEGGAELASRHHSYRYL